MSAALIDAYASAWEPEDRRPATEWAAEFVKPPHSARASQVDVTATPWLRAPIDALPDNSIKEMVLLMPTGAGKTTVFDVAVPRAIKTDPGSFLLTLQNDEEANAYWEERLFPILEGIEDVAKMIDRLPRKKKRRGFVALPHMSLYCSSLKWKAVQRKSVRFVGIDEAWMAPHGFIAEARARTHDRWNQRRIIASQGGFRFIEKDGEIVLTELEEAWQWTDQAQYSMVCPECSHVHAWCNAGLLFESGETGTGEIDERAILESARYKCPGRCGTEFPDKIDVRRQLSTESTYVATNDRALPGHIGFHVHATALYYVPWGQLALEWKRANLARKVGNYEPMKIYIQKRCAEFWDEHEHRFEGYKSDAPESDYVMVENESRFPGIKAGFPWAIEEDRFICADYQSGDGGYFVTCAAAFAANGESRVIHAARMNSADDIHALQERLGIVGKRVGIDCADETPLINSICFKYGWLELLGSDRMDWPQFDDRTRRSYRTPFSKPERVTGLAKAPWRASWSNAFFHDLHAHRLAHAGLAYGVPADIEDVAAYIDPGTQKPTGFWAQMRANHKVAKENKATGRRVMQWIRIGKRADHYRDARCMLLVMASLGPKGNGIGNCIGHSFEADCATTT
jgi:hypothetical protein